MSSKQHAVPAAWHQPIADYCEHLTGIGRTPLTVRAHRKALERIGRELGCAPAEITADRLISWSAGKQWKPETRRSYVNIARSFAGWAYRTGILSGRIELPLIKVPAPAPRPVPDAVWQQALASADPRTALMMRLAAEVGMRRAEVAQVHTRDVLDGPGGALLVVHGKGGKTRVVPISDELAATLRVGPNGYVFPGNDNGHLSAHYVGVTVANALPDGWSMHKLRHRFATRAYRHGGRNILAVRDLLGHTSVATTQRYTAVDDDEKRAAAMAATFATPDSACTPSS